MNAKRQTFLSVSKVIAYICLLLAVVGVIGFFAFFTNGFTDDFQSFYIMNSEKRYSSSNLESIDMPFDEDVRFDVKYTFGFMNKDEKKGYSVKIVPNITDETNFDFTVDGEYHMFADEKDLTAAFDIKLYEDYFTLTIPINISMERILASLYSGKSISTEGVLFAAKPYFALKILSYNEKAAIITPLKFYVGVQGITLDKEWIEIW